MKHAILLIATTILCCAAVANAESLRADFGYSGDADAFRLYEVTAPGKKELLVGDIPGTDRSVAWQQDIGNDCHTYFMTAMYGNAESMPSDGVSFCPETAIPEYVQRPAKVIIQGPITITVGD